MLSHEHDVVEHAEVFAARSLLPHTEQAYALERGQRPREPHRRLERERCDEHDVAHGASGGPTIAAERRGSSFPLCGMCGTDTIGAFAPWGGAL